MWECEGLSNLEHFDVVFRWAQSNGREWSIPLIYYSYVSIGWVPDINVEAFVQAPCQDDSKDEIETYSSLDFEISHNMQSAKHAKFSTYIKKTPRYHQWDLICIVRG